MPIMHEMAVTESILGIVVRHARRAGARRVVGINLVIGDLTGFIDESIQFYFDFLSRETVAHGAELRFQRVAARVRCPACGTEYEPPRARLWACPDCQTPGGQVTAGREFSVASIEVE